MRGKDPLAGVFAWGKRLFTSAKFPLLGRISSCRRVAQICVGCMSAHTVPHQFCQLRSIVSTEQHYSGATFISSLLLAPIAAFALTHTYRTTHCVDYLPENDSRFLPRMESPKGACAPRGFALEQMDKAPNLERTSKSGVAELLHP